MNAWVRAPWCDFEDRFVRSGESARLCGPRTNSRLFRRLSLVRASVLFAVLALLQQVSAQGLTITFEATFRGDPIPLDSIHVENLSGSGDTTIYHPDHVLVLDFSTGVQDLHDDAVLIRSMPNPFDGSTEIMLNSTGGMMRLAVYDATGRSMADLSLDAAPGPHHFRYSSGAPGLHVLSVEQNGQRHSLRLVALEGTGSTHGTLSHLGATDLHAGRAVAKADRSLFMWQPGDALRYIGYASNDTAMFSGVIEHTPVASATRTFTFFGATCPDAPTVMDADGNVYPVIRIGEQCWTGSNLRTAHYSDGSAIPNVTDNTEWKFLNTGAWCYYDNSPGQNATNGKLYNWSAAMDPRGVCPLGWHVPADAEWKQMESALGMSADELNSAGIRGEAQSVGGKLKSNFLWNAPNTGATNESGFSAFASGNRDGFSDGTFFNAGSHGYWWTSSDYGEFNYAWYRSLRSSMAGVGRYGTYKRNGFCIRCLRD